MEQIKAIETVYNGYRFRSRLEARWAVFFDAIGIMYEYEPEGFNLSGGVEYLPDFFLPDFCVFVEIKPNLGYTEKEKALREEWHARCRSFQSDTGQAICLFTGNPWDDHWNRLYAWDTTDSSGGEGDFEIRLVGFPRDFYWVDKPNVIIAVNDHRSDRRIYLDETFETYAGSVDIHNASSLVDKYPNACGVWVLSDLMTEFFDPKQTDLFTRAQLKARQARFEHGETP